MTRLDLTTKDDAMGLLDSMLEKGRAEGLATGLEKGKAVARKATLEKQLRLKFKSLPPEVAARIEDLDDAGVDRALEAVLTATSLDDVLPA